MLTLPRLAALQVVQEVYDEIVLWQPTEDFFNRYATHTARPAPPSQLAQVCWCLSCIGSPTVNLF